MGGLNIGNEYFRADPADADKTWRDQDVVVRGGILRDLVAAFDRNFDYFVGVKRSRGIFDTNLYWDATRAVMARTGKLPVHYKTDDQGYSSTSPRWRPANQRSTFALPRAASCRTGLASGKPTSSRPTSS